MAGNYPDYPDKFSGPGGLGISDYCGYRIIVSKTPGKKEYVFEAHEMDEESMRSTGIVIRRAGISFTKKSDAFKRAKDIIDMEIELQGDA